MLTRFDLIHLGGRVIAAADARIDPRDLAVTAGHALIETLAVIGGRALLVDEHLARLAASERELDWSTTPMETTVRAIDELITAAGADRAALRVLRSPGPPGGTPTLLLELRPLPQMPATGGTAAIARGGWALPAGIDELKHTGRLGRGVLRERARRGGHVECFLVDESGAVLEATAANVVVERGGRLITPPARPGILGGTVRGLLLAAGAIEEAPVALEDLARAREVALTSSLLGCWGLGGVEGRPEPLPGPTGSLVRSLSQILGPRVPSIDDLVCAASPTARVRDQRSSNDGTPGSPT